MMIDARMAFLGLTAILFTLLIAIALSTYRKSKKEKMEEPKYRMFDDE